MITKLMQSTEKKIVASLEKGIKAGREIAIAVSGLFDKWEENDEYKLPAEWLAERFDFSKQYIYKMESIAKRFLTADNAEKYDGIGVSVLMEALPLTDEQFDGLINDCEQNDVKLTQKTVRDYVKKCKMLEAKEETDEQPEEETDAQPEEETEVQAEEERVNIYDEEIETVVEEMLETISVWGIDYFREAVKRALARV